MNKKIILILLILIICIIGIITQGSTGQKTIENNTTIEINGVQLTVPKTGEYDINESTSLSNINDTEKFGMFSPVTENNAWEYYDGEHDISLYVVDANRTAYSDVEDFSELTTLDGDSERTHIEKKTVGDKIIVLYVTEGGNLSKLIVDSATRIE